MLASTTAEQQAIEGQDATVAFQVLISLPGSIYPDITLAIETGNVQTSMVTNAPANVGRPTGYTARQFTFTASGQLDPTDETKNPFWLFNKANVNSPLYRQTLRGIPVQLSYGVMVSGSSTPSWFRKFTGVTDDITINGDGTCNFICLDYRNKLRGTVDLPAVITAPPYNAGLTAEFALDALLRSASATTISSWPAQRPNCVLAVGMRSSMWPEVGTLRTDLDQPNPAFGPGPHGTGLATVAEVGGGYSEPVYSTSGPITSSVFIEFFVSGIAGGGIAVTVGDGASDVYQITVSPTRIEVDSGLTQIALWTTAIDSGTHYIGVQLNLPAAGSSAFGGGKFYLDTGSQTISPGTASVRATAAWTQVSLIVRGTGADDGSRLAGLQVTTETGPVGNGGFVPQAVLDPSLNPLTVTPAISGDPWDAIQAATAAERGYSGFDPFGIFRFKNERTLAGALSGRTVDTTRSLKDRSLQEAGGGGSVNHVTLPVNQWTFSAGQTVWTPGTALSVPRNGTLVQNVVLDTSAGLAGNIAVTDSGVLPNTTAPGGLTYWRAATDATGLSAVTSGVSVRITNPTSAGFTVTITNTNPFVIWLVSSAAYSDMPTGTPALFVGGILATVASTVTADSQWPPIAEGGAASTVQGDTTYAYDSSDWFQDLPTAQVLADETLVDLVDGITLVTNVDLIPDPRLDMGDVVTLVDNEVFGLNDPVTIFALNDTFGRGQWDQTASMSLVANFGFTILDLDGRCELDTNTYV